MEGKKGPREAGQEREGLPKGGHLLGMAHNGNNGILSIRVQNHSSLWNYNQIIRFMQEDNICHILRAGALNLMEDLVIVRQTQNKRNSSYFRLKMKQ